MRRALLCVALAAAGFAAEACSIAPTLPFVALVAVRHAVGTVGRLLEQHDADRPDADLTPPLVRAARSGALGRMTAILDAGANPDVRDAWNRWTPLLHAIHTRQLAAARLLLERGADPNMEGGRATPVLAAAADPDPRMLTLLLDYGADPEVRGEGGSTALSVAVSGGALIDIDRPLLGGCRPATVRALLAYDPALRLPDTIAGHEALWWAKFNRCDEVLKLVS
jgi:ankyrin repeat protein